MSSLLRGTKAPRGGKNSKRGNRGKGPGAADSTTASSKLNAHSAKPPIIDAKPAAGRNGSARSAQHFNKKDKHSNKHIADSITSPTEDDPYQAERLGNAAKRETLKGTINGEKNGRVVNKQVRFTSPLSQGTASPGTSRDSSAEPNAPTRELLTTKTTNSIFANPTRSFGASSNPSAAGQSNSSKIMSPFGAPAGPKFGAPSTSGFGVPSAPVSFSSLSNGNSTSPANSNPFAKPISSQPLTNGFSNFGAASTTASPAAFGSNSFSSKTQAPKFGASSTSAPSSSIGGFGSNTQVKSSASPFGGSTFGAQSTKSSDFGSTASKFGSTTPLANGVKSQPRPTNGTNKSFGANMQGSSSTPIVSSSKWALEMEKLLRKDGIEPPPWPTKNPGDPSQKAAIENHWRSYKKYRAKARACLTKNNFIDDPDKPKKLSEAIDFKGTCEEMCPEFEKIERIMESDVKGPEKELIPGHKTPWPAPHKMIKSLKRSAAGQEAPLPDDVRSPAALRRTTDYLIDEILTEADLPDVHGFLWDRTRAVRRDFTFQAQSMTTPEELLDQVYCLEQITRFHVIALHQMSPRRFGEKIMEDFSEQQEVEQLGRALLSLLHAYDDCKGHNVKCENEAEFRSYFVVFNAHHPGIMEQVQDWGWEFWGESDLIRTAINIVEAMQNTWDTHGPLQPESNAIIAQNAYSKFFSVVQDPSVSYTMACFAEIHFNKVRKSALKAIASSYRKQRDQTKEWTIPVLNEILHFDEEEDLEKFCEAYLITIESSEDEEPYLSLEENYDMRDPFPQLSQLHSELVERKRGSVSLQDAIHRTIYEEVEDEDSMFIPESRSRTQSKPAQVLKRPVIAEKTAFNWSSAIPDQEVPKSPPPTNPLFNPLASSAIADTPSLFQNPLSTTGGSSFSFGNESSKGMQHTNTPSPPNSFGNKPPEAKGLTFDFSPKPSSPTPPAAFVQPAISQKQPEPSASFSGFKTPPTGTQNPNPSPFSLPKPQATSESAANSLKLPDFGSVAPMKPPVDPSAPPAATSSPLFGLQPAVSTSAPFTAPTKEKESLSMKLTQPQPPVPASQPPPPLESYLPAFADWFTNGVNGIIPQFLEHQVEQILLQTVAQYQREEEERRMKKAEEKARGEADRFRQRSLAIKYGRLWRENAHALWRRRQAIEHRMLRAERMKELKAAKEAAKAVDIVAEFTASTKRKSFDELTSGNAKSRSSEDMLRATGILDFVHDPNREIRNIVRPDKGPRRAERSESPLVIPPAPSDQHLAGQKHEHRRTMSQSRLRTSLLSNHSYLHGGSRSFLLPNDSPGLYESTAKNNVKTDYFRMKARGIMTLPNGTPIANSAAKHLLRQKRSFDGIVKNTTPKRSIRRPEARSVPAKPNRSLLGESDDELSQLKERAKGLMNGGNESPVLNKNKRLHDDSDEELFAKAKRIREQMDEGAKWFREEMRRESLSGSGSGAHYEG